MTEPPPVPRGFDQVTPEWLTAALLETHPGIRVTAATVDPTMGHKPNKGRVHLRYDEAGARTGLPSTLVVKGTFNGTVSRGSIIDFANMAELVSYCDILPRLTVNAPQLFHQASKAEPSEAVLLLLEDLADRRPTYFPNGFATLGSRRRRAS